MLPHTLRTLVVALLLTLLGGHARARPAFIPSAPAPAALTSLRRAIDDILSAPVWERTYWGVLVRSLEANDTLYSRNAGKLMMPASNMKLVTLAAAAERLGWNFSFETQVFALGAIEGGVLDGDLLVVGSGDPTIGHEEATATVFDTWADQLRAAGIGTIRGRIIGDDNAFDEETLGAGWAWDYLGDGYATGVGALQYNENVVWLSVEPARSAGSVAVVTASPEGSGLAIDSDVRTGPAGSILSVTTRRIPGSNRLIVRGSVPVGSTPWGHSVSVDNPTIFFVNALRAALVAHGIEVHGGAVDIDDLAAPPDRSDGVLLTSYRSPPLSVLATRMMKTSRNLYAETLLKTLGALAGMPSAAGGREVVKETVQRWGVPSSGLVMIDGSGLSRYNLVTPETLVTILAHAARDERLRGTFENTLPIAGKDGSLAGRLKDTRAQNNVRAKTGTIANVRALSGYVKSAGNETVVFSIIANNFETTIETVDRAEDAIAVRLAEFKR